MIVKVLQRSSFGLVVAIMRGLPRRESSGLGLFAQASHGRMMNLRLMRIGKGIFVLAFGLSAALPSFAEYRVSVKPGDDLIKVRDDIRAARKDGRIALDEAVTVTLVPGMYMLPRKLSLDEADSGSESAPVVWRAEQPGSVRFFGGRMIPRTAFGPVADATVRKRLDAAVCDKVQTADVTPFLVCPLPTWNDVIDGVLPGPWLYFGGEPQTLARWPNADAPDGGWFGYSNLVDRTAFVFPGDRASRWKVQDGVWLNGYWMHDWYSAYVRLADYDAPKRVARLAAEPKYGLGAKGLFPLRRIHAVNLLEELDAPGEWYLDKETKRLYWYTPSGGKGEIFLAQDLTPFIHLVNVSHVRFENLSFEYSHGRLPAFVMTNCRRCVVSRCAFLNLAGQAVDVVGVRNRVTECTIRNIGGSALSVAGGDVKTLLPANNLVDHCTFDNLALFKRTFAPGINVRGCGNSIRNNIVTRSPYIALMYWGNEHLIADNEFSHVVLEAGDSGAIYTGYCPSFLGTLIFGNHIHDLAKTPLECAVRNGIYFDDCVWGGDVIGNTFERTGVAVFFGGGKLHRACNNLMRNCRVAVYCDSRGRSWRNCSRTQFGWDAQGYTFARRTVASTGVDVRVAPWRVMYPQLEEALDNLPELPGMNVVTGNVVCACEKAFSFDRDAQKVLGCSPAGNLVITNAAAASGVAPQPICLKDAARNVCRSEDGGTSAVFALDESGHFSWALKVRGRHVLDLSPLGITVGTFDFGRRVVPGVAEAKGTVPLSGWRKGTVRVPSPCARDGGAWKNAETNVMLAATARTWCIPLKSLVSGETVAYLDVRVWNGGAAYRWTVPGTGVRRVVGENDSFVIRKEVEDAVCLLEFDRAPDLLTGYPESFYYDRGPALGVSFPERASGWDHEGTVVSPWRAVILGDNL